MAVHIEELSNSMNSIFCLKHYSWSPCHFTKDNRRRRC